LFLTILALNWLQCTSDKAPLVDITSICQEKEVGYALNIKPIIDNNCALGGCHVNGGDGTGLYNNYADVVRDIENGSFERTVIDLKDDPNIGMPPDWSNNGAPKDLSDSELELVKCWLEKGYPE